MVVGPVLTIVTALCSAFRRHVTYPRAKRDCTELVVNLFIYLFSIGFELTPLSAIDYIYNIYIAFILSIQ